MEKVFIKLSPITIIVIILFVIIVAFGVIYLDRKRVSKNVSVKREMRIDTTIVYSTSSTIGRGWFPIIDSLVINSSSKLISNPNGYNNWDFKGPIKDFDTIPYVHRLGDLSVPFKIFKQADNDTILVLINGITLKFLLRE